jgi:hypothetical protein
MIGGFFFLVCSTMLYYVILSMSVSLNPLAGFEGRVEDGDYIVSIRLK